MPSRYNGSFPPAAENHGLKAGVNESGTRSAAPSITWLAIGILWRPFGECIAPLECLLCLVQLPAVLAPTSIKDALNQTAPVEKILVQGWVRTRRDAKDFSFIELNDGSSLRNLQIIARNSLPNYAAIQRLITGASIIVGGGLAASQGKGQQWELIADEVTIVGASDESYPLQKKGHTPEFLREIAHLRPRSNLFGCVFRVRSRLAFAIHQFFQERGFYYIHTPIITGSDCEGAGELFRVTGIDYTNPPRKPDGSIDYNRDFFGRSTYLTVSGQLEAEAFASALSKVYTFGPTFRAENSNTSRHANEFWMIEPEMAFTDLKGNMDLAEEIVKYLIRDVREKCLEVLEANMQRHKMEPKDYKWYLDLRRYGTVPHSGFGLGFERMLMFVTGVSNIRDVIPFARTPGSAEF